MKRLATAERIVDAIGVSVGLLVCRFITDYLSVQQVDRSLSVVLCIAVVLILVKVLSTIWSEAVKRSMFLRKHILFDDYIEGVWFGAGRNACAIVTLEIRDNQAHVMGEEFSPDGNIRMTWSTLASTYDGSSLRYIYRGSRVVEGNSEERLGFCALDFVRVAPNRRPSYYNGYFVDASTKFERLSFSGRRVTDREALKLLESEEGRRLFVLDAFTKLRPVRETSENALPPSASV